MLAAIAGISVYAQDGNHANLSPGKVRKRVLSKKFLNVPGNVRSFHAIGTINVLVHVDKNGIIERVNMLSGFSHIGFMKSYIEAEVASWKFKPLMIKGERTPFRGVVSIPFCYGSFPKKRWC